MAFSPCEVDTAVIAALATLPNDDGGLTDAQLKAKFDKAPTDLKAWIVAFLAEIASTADGSSGADNTGATAISGLTGATVQALLEALKNKVDSVNPVGGFINPKDPTYGAKGDGATNDTTAILAAIAAMGAYDVLYLPAGTYMVAVNQLKITTNNIRITGPGVLKAITGTTGYFLRIQASNVVIDGVGFDGGYSLFDETEPAVTAITIETPADGGIISDITVKNCRLYNWTTYGIAVTENSDDNTVKNKINNVKFLNNYVKACVIPIEVFPKVLSENIEVDGNYCEVIGTYADSTAMKAAQAYKKAVVTNNICVGGVTSGWAIGIAAEDQLYSNNIVITSGTAIGINNTDHALFTPGYITNVELSNNVIISTSGVALLINGKYDFTNMKISGNEFIGSTYSLYMQPSNTATGNLSNVFFSDNGWSGNLKIFRSADNSKVVKNVHFDGDTMDDQFDCQYVANIDFKNVVSESVPTFALQFTGCSYASLKNSKVKNSLTEGLVISGGSRINIDSCEFINCNTSNTASTNCLNVVGAPDIVTIKNCIFLNESGVGYATRAVYVNDGTNIFVTRDNIYIGMVNAGIIYFGVLVYAGMEKANKIIYATNIPSTEFATATFAVYDEAINTTKTEAGGAGSKYVTEGWVCSVAGTPGTWLPRRALTGN